MSKDHFIIKLIHTTMIINFMLVEYCLLNLIITLECKKNPKEIIDIKGK